MSEQTNALSDRNLEASTTLSLKREPACFVFLCGSAISPPQPIDAINLDLASVDYFSGRASDDRPMAILGFDESFLSPFTRALIESASSRVPYRMTITVTGERPKRLVEYVTGPGVALSELIITPQDNVMVISGRTSEGDEETLFQLPRTD